MMYSCAPSAKHCLLSCGSAEDVKTIAGMRRRDSAGLDLGEHLQSALAGQVQIEKNEIRLRRVVIIARHAVRIREPVRRLRRGTTCTPISASLRAVSNRKTAASSSSMYSNTWLPIGPCNLIDAKGAEN